VVSLWIVDRLGLVAFGIDGQYEHSAVAKPLWLVHIAQLLIWSHMLIGLSWEVNRKQRFDRIEKPNENIMQARQDIRLACYLLYYIAFLLTFSLAFLAEKLH
jgi:hypothetical protein